jgi:asparagine synthase (glutamine-hydrolysing)
MVSIDLIFNTGFSWYSTADIHVKGFAYAPDGQFLRGEAFLEYFKDCLDLTSFRTRITGANGMFSIVLRRDGRTFLGVDRMRTFPLFYFTGPGRTYISDSVDRIIDSAGGWSLDSDAVAEFLATGYVTGEETLAEGILQVQAGEILEIRDPDNDEIPGIKLSGEFYSSYRCADTGKGSLAQLEDHLDSLTNRVFERLVKSLQGRTAVIALSGGYDSRFVAAMLKKLDYPRVVCFSYGREGNQDMMRAGEVAGILGFPFIPIVYTEEMIRDYLDEPDFKGYLNFTSNRTSMFFMQEYFAMRQLSRNKMVPEDSVFIPGHSGDFFGGSQLIKHGLHEGRENLHKTVQRLYDIKYAWFRPGGAEKKSMLDRIGRTIEEKDIIRDALPYSIHEDWDLKEKLSKFLVNSCNIYAWYGFEYRLPLYDYELQDFFRDVPFKLKSNKILYDSYLKTRIFSGFGLNFPDEFQPDEKTQRKAWLKRRLKKILPDALLPTTVSSQDPIFYHEITRVLQKDLAGKGIEIKIRANTYNSLIVQWYIEYLKSELSGS